MTSPAASSTPIALVTGASGGIGRACALALAKNLHAQIAVHFNASAEAAQSVVADLKTLGVQAIALQADLAQPGAAAKLLDDCVDQLGAPTILIHAAGHLLEKPLAFTAPAEWDALFEVHVFSAAALLKSAARHFRKSSHGRVVLIGSLAGQIGLGNGSAYAAAKGALEGLCKSAALEFAHFKTTVNLIAPGFIDTHMTAVQSGEQRAALSQKIPLERFGTPEEIAAAAAFLCSPEAAYITGQSLVIDGGISLG